MVRISRKIIRDFPFDEKMVEKEKNGKNRKKRWFVFIFLRKKPITHPNLFFLKIIKNLKNHSPKSDQNPDLKSDLFLKFFFEKKAFGITW